MGKTVTTYDIDLRVSYINQSIASLGNDLMIRRKAGMNCRESECKLALLNVYKEIISCYRDGCSEIDYACFTEETLQKVLQTAGTLAGVCFPPTGLIRTATVCTPEPKIVPLREIET